MVAATDSVIARLQAECTDAEAQERAVRAAVEAKVREAEQARAFAWRRLNALGDMARNTALEPDRERTDTVAARKLREVEADVTADLLTLNRGLFFDRDGRHLLIDEVAR